MGVRQAQLRSESSKKENNVHTCTRIIMHSNLTKREWDGRWKEKKVEREAGGREREETLKKIFIQVTRPAMSLILLEEEINRVLSGVASAK